MPSIQLTPTSKEAYDRYLQGCGNSEHSEGYYRGDAVAIAEGLRATAATVGPASFNIYLELLDVASQLDRS
jgi:hypothetical protein